MKKILLLLFFVFFTLKGFSQTYIMNFGINDHEIMLKDFGKMKWYDALKVCDELPASDEGYEWHLPSKFEFDIIYKNQEKIFGFKDDRKFWSANQFQTSSAWVIFMENGYWHDGYNSGNTRYGNEYYVRCIRTLKSNRNTK